MVHVVISFAIVFDFSFFSFYFALNIFQLIRSLFLRSNFDNQQDLHPWLFIYSFFCSCSLFTYQTRSLGFQGSTTCRVFSPLTRCMKLKLLVTGQSSYYLTEQPFKIKVLSVQCHNIISSATNFYVMIALLVYFVWSIIILYVKLINY